MREADRRCIEELGIPGAVLMNNAGAAVFQELPCGPVGVVCGKGNNGGDGFVVARLALLAGWETQVLLLAAREEIGGDAAVFMRAYENLGGPIVSTTNDAEIRRTLDSFASHGCIVDAILGTGTSGALRGPARTAIDHWPDVHTVAVDIPSGLNADTGAHEDICVRAQTTVTFQFVKAGLLESSAQEYVGRLVVADIGIPTICADDAAWFAHLNGVHTPSP